MVLSRGRWRGLPAIGHFYRLRTLNRFCRAFAVGVFGFHRDGFAFVIGCELVSRALPDFCVIGEPAVGDGAKAVFVFEVVGGSQGLADFRFTADGDATNRGVVLSRRRWRGLPAIGHFYRLRALSRFRRAFAVGVFGFHRDGFAFVIGCELVSRALPDFCVIGEPAVGDGAKAVFVFEVVGGSQGLANFRFTADGHAARRFVVRLCRRLDTAVFYGFGLFAHRPFAVFRPVFVARTYADFLSYVRRRQLVVVCGRSRDFFAFAQPLVFHFPGVVAVSVFQFRRQGVAYAGIPLDFQLPFLVRRVFFVVADGDFGLVPARVAVAVAQDVFHRIRVAFFKVVQRFEGDVSARVYCPGALFFDDELFYRVAVFVQQFQGTRVNVVLRVGVVFGDFDGHGFVPFALHGVVLQVRFVAVRVAVRQAVRVPGCRVRAGRQTRVRVRIGVGRDLRRWRRVVARRVRLWCRQWRRRRVDRGVVLRRRLRCRFERRQFWQASHATGAAFVVVVVCQRNAATNDRQSAQYGQRCNRAGSVGAQGCRCRQFFCQHVFWRTRYRVVKQAAVRLHSNQRALSLAEVVFDDESGALAAVEGDEEVVADAVGDEAFRAEAGRRVGKLVVRAVYRLDVLCAASTVEVVLAKGVAAGVF